MLDWVKACAYARNETVGVRGLYVDVQAGNSGAFQQYANKWRFTPIPPAATEKHAEGRKVDASWKKAPDYVAPDDFIGMYYDLYNEFGSFISGLGSEAFGD